MCHVLWLFSTALRSCWYLTGSFSNTLLSFQVKVLVAHTALYCLLHPLYGLWVHMYGPHSRFQIFCFLIPRNGVMHPKAWLMSRVCFSPYQATFWEWSLETFRDGPDGQRYLASPCWTSGLPNVISHTKLVRDVAALPQPTDWRWNIVPYEVRPECFI